jgi:hypothetical protein
VAEYHFHSILSTQFTQFNIQQKIRKQNAPYKGRGFKRDLNFFVCYDFHCNQFILNKLSENKMIKIEKVVMFDFLHIKNLYLFELKKVTKKIRTYKKNKNTHSLGHPIHKGH